MTARRLPLALALFAIACTQAHEADPFDPCVDLDPNGWACARAWVAALDRDHCRYFRECLGLSFSDDLCDAYFPEAGAWGAIQYDDHRLALEEGRVRFDPEALRCLLGHMSRCESGPMYRCGPELVATHEHAEGDPCGDPYECGDHMACVNADRRCGEALGTCRRTATEGGACGPEVGGCDYGLTCAEGRCVSVSAIEATAIEGEPCGIFVATVDGRWVERQCAPSLGCSVDEHVCVALPRCGEQVCEAYSECSTATTCEPFPTPREGDSCTGAQCAWGAFGFTCNAATRTCERTERLMGDTCHPAWTPCAEGVCTADDDDGGSFHCTGPAPSGAPCWYDRQCASHACCDHACS